MEIFYSFESGDAGKVGGLQGCTETEAARKVGGRLRLDAEESAHCVRVLRHRVGDSICVVDGRGTMYRCTIESTGAPDTAGGEKRFSDRQKGSRTAKAGGDSGCVTAKIDSVEAGWHSHPYNLTMAVCPTKNPDRYEWMVEKLCEIGVDTIAPVIGDRSERRILKTDRLRRLVLSAAKQSLKASFPVLEEPVSVMEFIAVSASRTESLRFIAYCSDEIQPRAGLAELLADVAAGANPASSDDGQAPSAPSDSGEGLGHLPEIIVLIGPEGDFSPEEVRAAMDAGFIPVHLGASRLRTETAAIVAATAVYIGLSGGSYSADTQ